MRRILFILLVFAAINPCGAQTSALNNKKAKLEKDIAILDAQIKENRKKSNNAETALKLTRSKISSRRQLLEQSEKEIKALDRKIAAKNDTIAKLSARLDSMSAAYNRLVRTAYRSRDSRVWYMYLLASEDLGQGLRRYGYLRSLSVQMRTQATRIKEAQAVLLAQKAEAEALRKNAAALRGSRLAEIEKLRKEESDSKALVSQLSKNDKKYKKQLASKKKEKEALDRELKRLVEKASKSTSGKKTAIDTKLDAEFAANMGKLPWPADGPVVEGFGYHYHPVYKNVRLPFNNGINIALSPSTAVKAVFNGKVSQVIVMPGYNQCVLVQHGGYFTFYCKLANVSVKAGDKIKTGQVIGLVDTISGETQLHFELWEDKTPKNPELWLR